jgi:hypothetical protein
MISLCEYSLWIFLSTRIFLSEVLELSRLERILATLLSPRAHSRYAAVAASAFSLRCCRRERILATLLSPRANSRLRRCRRERILATLLSPRANSGDAVVAASKFRRRCSRREQIQATLLSSRANSGDAALASSEFGRRCSRHERIRATLLVLFSFYLSHLFCICSVDFMVSFFGWRLILCV